MLMLDEEVEDDEQELSPSDRVTTAVEVLLFEVEIDEEQDSLSLKVTLGGVGSILCEM